MGSFNGKAPIIALRLNFNFISSEFSWDWFLVYSQFKLEDVILRTRLFMYIKSSIVSYFRK